MTEREIKEIIGDMSVARNKYHGSGYKSGIRRGYIEAMRIFYAKSKGQETKNK